MRNTKKSRGRRTEVAEEASRAPSAYLEVLVILGKIKTGRRKGEIEEEVNIEGHKVLGGPVVYYARK